MSTPLIIYSIVKKKIKKINEQCFYLTNSIWFVKRNNQFLFTSWALHFRFKSMWLLTNDPATSTEQRFNSPAKTPAATMRANSWALRPGVFTSGPRTPRRSSIVLCDSNTVPPPTVPTSRDGMDTDICKAPLTLNGRRRWNGSASKPQTCSPSSLVSC